MRLGFVSVPPIFLVAVAKGVPGVGYMAAHLQQKNPFYFKKKNPPRQKVNHKAYISSSFRRKTGSIIPTSSAEGSISLQHLLLDVF